MGTEQQAYLDSSHPDIAAAKALPFSGSAGTSPTPVVCKLPQLNPGTWGARTCIYLLFFGRRNAPGMRISPQNDRGYDSILGFIDTGTKYHITRNVKDRLHDFINITTVLKFTSTLV